VWEEGSHHRYHETPMDFLWYLPIFMAEEFTYDIVRARGRERAFVYPVREGDDSVPETEFTEYVLHTEFEFGVLFEGNILVRVRAVGTTAEELWDMFAPLVQ